MENYETVLFNYDQGQRKQRTTRTAQCWGQAEYKQRIWGSASPHGLLCLRVFFLWLQMSHLHFSASASLHVTGRKNVYVPCVVNGMKCFKWWQVLLEILSLVPTYKNEGCKRSGTKQQRPLRGSLSFPKNSHESSCKAVYSVPQFPVFQTGTTGSAASSPCPFFLLVSSFFGVCRSRPMLWPNPGALKIKCPAIQ